MLTVKLDEPSVIRAVKLDNPEKFDVLKVIAGPSRVDKGHDLDISISPPNAYVTVLVKLSEGVESPAICGGDLLLDGEPSKVVPSPPPTASPQAPNPMVVHRNAPIPQATYTGEAVKKVTYDADSRGWPLGGMNEVWVLMGRGEAERLVQAINGYPISAPERPALLRRFHQALGLIR